MNGKGHARSREYAVSTVDGKVGKPRFDALARVAAHGQKLRKGVEEGMGRGDDGVDLPGFERVDWTPQCTGVHVGRFFR